MKTICSIDGGGMRGYVPCSVLADLELQTGKACTEIFDMFAGTSIGGILACLLASGKTAHTAMGFFTYDGPIIFGRRQFLGWRGILRPRYSGAVIERQLRARLGEVTLSQCKKSLLVPAFDMNAYAPYFFKSPANQHEDYKLWQVSRASSAAQSYFPAYEIGNRVFWDGGNVANNPTLCAVAEAVRLWPGEPLRILSLSCGESSSCYAAKRLVSANIFKVAVETFNLTFAANDELPDYILRQVLPGGYFRVAPTDTTDIALDGVAAEDLRRLYTAATRCQLDSQETLKAFINYRD